MYKALFTSAYFGLLCISELTGIHAVLARDVQIGVNKRKFLLTLRTSKTHWVNNRPQQIKISATSRRKHNSNSHLLEMICPFSALERYSKLCGDYTTDSEQFFVFSDGSLVKSSHMRTCLKNILKNLKKDWTIFQFHRIRSGRACDLLKLGGIKTKTDCEKDKCVNNCIVLMNVL